MPERRPPRRLPIKSAAGPETLVSNAMPSATVPFLSPPLKSRWNSNEACPRNPAKMSQRNGRFSTGVLPSSNAYSALRYRIVVGPDGGRSYTRSPAGISSPGRGRMRRRLGAADSKVLAKPLPDMTVVAPAARARTTSRELRMPPSAMNGTRIFLARSAIWKIAVNCGTPKPVTMRVEHAEPGPTPTLTQSAPASTRSW
eukprot:Amastigsp_a339432_566.p3 type:complete len:199 gc:universal Amastigsp_a339432_566:123-719(+)